jgi:hypothetical protein
MAKKKQNLNFNLAIFIIGFISFSIAWAILLLIFMFIEFGNSMSNTGQIIGGKWSMLIYDLLIFVPVPIAGVFVYFFSNGSLRKAAKAAIFGFVILLVALLIISKGDFFRSISTHINYALTH